MKKKTHKKMDRYLIATLEPHEIEYIQKKFHKEGITTHKKEIQNAVKQVGHSRRKVYAFIRSCHN